MGWRDDLSEGVKRALITASAVSAGGLLYAGVGIDGPARWFLVVPGAILAFAPYYIAGLKCLDPTSKVFGHCVGCVSVLGGLFGATALLLHLHRSYPELVEVIPTPVVWLMLAGAMVLCFLRLNLALGKILAGKSSLVIHSVYIAVNLTLIPGAVVLTHLALASLLYPSVLW